MSFLRHGEIYLPMRSSALGRPWPGRPSPHRYDEFPAGYSLAGCAPAEPASASPADTQVGTNTVSSTIEKQRMAGRPLTACLTQGDNPSLAANTRAQSPGEAKDRAFSKSWGIIAVTPTGQCTRFASKGSCTFFTRFKRNSPPASARRKGMWI